MLEGGGATCSRSHAAARSRTVGYTRGKDCYLWDARNQPRGICKTKISLPEREDGRCPWAHSGDQGAWGYGNDHRLPGNH